MTITRSRDGAAGRGPRRLSHYGAFRDSFWNEYEGNDVAGSGLFRWLLTPRVSHCFRFAPPYARGQPFRGECSHARNQARVLAAAAAAPAIIRSPPRRGRRSRAGPTKRAGIYPREIATPALVLDLDGFEANVSKMTAHLKSAGKGSGPTARRTSVRRSPGAGAGGGRRELRGKLSEAEVFAALVPGLLVTTQVLGRQKMARAWPGHKHRDRSSSSTIPGACATE